MERILSSQAQAPRRPLASSPVSHTNGPGSSSPAPSETGLASFLPVQGATSNNDIDTLHSNGFVVALSSKKWMAQTTASATVQVSSGFSVLPSRSGVVLPNGQTLGPGSATTVSGTLWSLSPSESVIIIGGSSTISLPTQANVVLPNGQTIIPGVLTTVSGVPISLSADKIQAVVNGSTISLASTALDGLGSYLWGGLGIGASTSGPAQPTGGADRLIGHKGGYRGFVGIILSLIQFMC